MVTGLRSVEICWAINYPFVGVVPPVMLVKLFHFHRGDAVTVDPFLQMAGMESGGQKRDFLKIFWKKHFDLAGWKLRCLTGIHAGPRIFVSVLSNVPNFISEWMFLYVKRWEGKSVKNWCSWVFCEEARLGREKERSKVLCQLKALITQLSSCWDSKMPTCFSLRWPSSNRRAKHREYK